MCVRDVRINTGVFAGVWNRVKKNSNEAQTGLHQKSGGTIYEAERAVEDFQKGKKFKVTTMNDL